MRTSRIYPARTGFTVAELLIIVVLFAALATIVVPQMASAEADPREGILADRLRAIEAQIDLYRAHTGTLPTLEMIGRAPLEDAAGDGFGGLVDGGYLDASPVNPYTGGSAVPADWVYEPRTGRVTAVRR